LPNPPFDINGLRAVPDLLTPQSSHKGAELQRPKCSRFRGSA
jgi:hypothetical protein